MNHIFPFQVTGSGSMFNPVAWFWVLACTFGNAVCLAIYVATVLLVFNTVMQ